MSSINKKTCVVIFVSLLMLGMLNVTMPVSAKPSAIHVYPGESIQAAVDAANPGDKIIVHAGTYYQNFTVNKSLTVMGSGAIIDRSGTGNDTAIYVAAGGVTISGFTIKVPAIPIAPPNPYPSRWAIRLNGTFSGGLIENNYIYSNYSGIQINGFNGTQVSDVMVRNNKVTAVTAISAVNSPNLVIRDNVISAVVNPDYPSSQPAGILVVQGSPSGVPIPAVSNVSIQNNKVNSECNGIAINGASGVNIYDAKIQCNIVTAKPSEILTSLTPTSVVYAVQAQNTPNVLISLNVLSVKGTLSPATPQPLGEPVGIHFGGQALTGGIVQFNAINSDYWGIKVDSQVQFTPTEAKVQYNWIYSSIVGIYLPNINVVVKGNVISAKANSMFTRLPNGIMLAGGTDGALIESNKINSEYYGIWISFSFYVAVHSNIVCASVIAISANEAANIVISNNVLSAKNNTKTYPDVRPYGIEVVKQAFPFVADALIEGNVVSSDAYGININGQTNTIVTSNKVTAVRAINANNAPNVTIKNNDVTSKNSTMDSTFGSFGIQLQGNFQGGLIQNNEISADNLGINVNLALNPAPSNIQVLNNKVFKSITALAVTAKTGITVTGNFLCADQVGLRVMAPNFVVNPMVNPIVTDNIVYSRNDGIVLGNVVGATVQNNKVYIQNLIPVPSGLVFFTGIVFSGNSSSIDHNTVSGDFVNGIYIMGTIVQLSPTQLFSLSTANTVAENKITGGTTPNDVGIYLDAYTSGNSVIHNTITGVDTTIQDDGTGNIITP